MGGLISSVTTRRPRVWNTGWNGSYLRATYCRSFLFLCDRGGFGADDPRIFWLVKPRLILMAAGINLGQMTAEQLVYRHSGR